MIHPHRSRNVNRLRISAIYLAIPVVVSFFCPFFFTAIASALDIKLAWNASQLADGYRLFCREQDEQYDYMRPHWEGSVTQCTVFNLNEDGTYYFVVRAFNDFGESGDSNEIRYPDDGDGGGGGGGCIISTAASGSCYTTYEKAY